MLAKLTSQGVAAAFFSLRCPEDLQNEKNFLYLEIAKINMGEGGQFLVKKNDSEHKNSFFFKLNPFFKGK